MGHVEPRALSSINEACEWWLSNLVYWWWLWIVFDVSNMVYLEMMTAYFMLFLSLCCCHFDGQWWLISRLSDGCLMMLINSWSDWWFQITCKIPVANHKPVDGSRKMNHDQWTPLEPKGTCDLLNASAHASNCLGFLWVSQLPVGQHGKNTVLAGNHLLMTLKPIQNEGALTIKQLVAIRYILHTVKS